MRGAKGGLVVAAVSAALALVPACTTFEPEVGDQLPQCVDADSDPETDVVFKDRIRPLMNGIPGGPKPCAFCHYHSRGLKLGLEATHLDLETLGTLRKGGINTSDDILVPGKPCSSAIVQKLRGQYDVGARMPLGGPYWSPEQVQIVIDWIAEGAKGADDE